MAEIAEELIAERRATYDPTNTSDLLSLLLSLRDEDGSQFTDEEIRDEALTLILSGHETTANMLTWAFSWLAAHPDVLAALQQEADTSKWVLDKRAPTLEEAMQAEIAGQVLSESLRMAPPVWVAPRRHCVIWISVASKSRPAPMCWLVNTSPSATRGGFRTHITGIQADGVMTLLRPCHAGLISRSVPAPANAWASILLCWRHASFCYLLPTRWPGSQPTRAGRCQRPSPVPLIEPPVTCRSEFAGAPIMSDSPAHQAAISRGDPGYLDPDTGLYVMTAAAHENGATAAIQGVGIARSIDGTAMTYR